MPTRRDIAPSKTTPRARPASCHTPARREVRRVRASPGDTVDRYALSMRGEQHYAGQRRFRSASGVAKSVRVHPRIEDGGRRPFGRPVWRSRLTCRVGLKGGWSGRLDSNQRSLGPEPSAIPCFATPRQAGATGSLLQVRRPRLGPAHHSASGFAVEDPREVPAATTTTRAR